jgi:hypothetical protein
MNEGTGAARGLVSPEAWELKGYSCTDLRDAISSPPGVKSSRDVCKDWLLSLCPAQLGVRRGGGGGVVS